MPGETSAGNHPDQTMYASGKENWEISKDKNIELSAKDFLEIRQQKNIENQNFSHRKRFMIYWTVPKTIYK